jgi:Ser/Thr protein kinase RdoA (MazF antagonist)
MPAPDAAPTRTPYAGLTPSLVLDALDAVDLRGDGRLIQLNSYENRVFQVFLEDGRVVVAKFYRPGRWSDAQILEEHAFATELEAAEIPVAAPWPLSLSPTSIHADGAAPLGATLVRFDSPAGPYRFGVCARQAGRAPELEDPATLEWIGRFIGRIHAVGARSRFAHRETLDVATFGHANRERLLASGVIPPDALPAWRDVTARALERVGAAFESVDGARSLRLHGDCHVGNLLWTAAGPHFVDLDDAVNGPATQDLWMLLSGERSAMTRQLAAILEGYESFMDFDWHELRLLEPLRTLRIIHHSAWIARRWDDPAFPIAFPWFESPAYWADQTTRLREQLVAMDEPPLGSPAV